MDAEERLRRARLAAQRLMPATACSSAEEAARTVIGVQAQDLRAARLALRSRVPGLTRGAVSAAPLLRTWTVRGTVHLIAASDRPWLHALVGERNARAFGARLERFGIVDVVNAMRRDVVELCAERPRDRASLLRALLERGHSSLEQGPINTFVPWLSAQGLIVTDVDGLLHAADPPPAVDHDEALAIPRRPLHRWLWPVRRDGPREVVGAADNAGTPGARCGRSAAGPRRVARR